VEAIAYLYPGDRRERSAF